MAAEAALLNLKSTVAAGIFTGALTNTPALAQVLSYVTHGPLQIASTAVGSDKEGYRREFIDLATKAMHIEQTARLNAKDGGQR